MSSWCHPLFYGKKVSGVYLCSQHETFNTLWEGLASCPLPGNQRVDGILVTSTNGFHEISCILGDEGGGRFRAYHIYHLCSKQTFKFKFHMVWLIISLFYWWCTSSPDFIFHYSHAFLSFLWFSCFVCQFGPIFSIAWGLAEPGFYEDER